MRSRQFEGKALSSLRERMHREHDHICYALERRDPDAARALLRLHLSSSRDRLRDSVAQQAP